MAQPGARATRRPAQRGQGLCGRARGLTREDRHRGARGHIQRVGGGGGVRRVDTWRSPRRGRLAAQHSVVHAARPRAVRARAWARAKPQFAPSSQLQLGDPCQILIGPMTGKLGREWHQNAYVQPELQRPVLSDAAQVVDYSVCRSAQRRGCVHGRRLWYQPP